MRKFLVISMVLVSFSVFAAKSDKTVGETVTSDVVWDKACNCNKTVNSQQERSAVLPQKDKTATKKDSSVQ